VRGCFDSNIDQANHKGKEKPTSLAPLMASDLTDKLISDTDFTMELADYAGMNEDLQRSEE
jgi:hypothetical protein